MQTLETPRVIGKRIKCECCDNWFLITPPDNPSYQNLLAYPLVSGEYFVVCQHCNSELRHTNFLYWAKSDPKDRAISAKTMQDILQDEAIDHRELIPA